MNKLTNLMLGYFYNIFYMRISYNYIINVYVINLLYYLDHIRLSTNFGHLLFIYINIFIKLIINFFLRLSKYIGMKFYKTIFQ